MDSAVENLAQFLHGQSITLSQVFEHILLNSRGKPAGEWLLHDVLQSTRRLMPALCRHHEPYSWMVNANEHAYVDELRELVKKEHGWHFSALHAREDQITNFKLDEMTTNISVVAPRLWRLFTTLSHANAGGGEEPQGAGEDDDEEQDLDGLEDENLIGRDDARRANVPRERASPRTISKRREKLRSIVSRRTRT